MIDEGKPFAAVEAMSMRMSSVIGQVYVILRVWHANIQMMFEPTRINYGRVRRRLFMISPVRLLRMRDSYGTNCYGIEKVSVKRDMARTKLAAYLGATIGLAELKNFRFDFEKRLEVQKIGYFAQQFGANLGYNFGWYHHGPYSTRLADDAYSLALLTESGVKVMDVFPDEPGQKELKTFVEDISRTQKDSKKTLGHWLELAASLHYIMKYSYPPVRNLRSATDVLKQMKPLFTQSEIVRAYRMLRKRKLL